MDSMEDFAVYLKDTLGLTIKQDTWARAESLPYVLRDGVHYAVCEVNGVAFLAARFTQQPELPTLKRVVTQLARYSGLPAVAVPLALDPRQRKALISQGFPFVVPGKQAYLPFLALIAEEGRSEHPSVRGSLSARAQALLVALVANPDATTLGKLRKLTALSASDISRGIDELEARCLVNKGKAGREVTVALCDSAPNTLHSVAGCMTSPVKQTLYVKATAEILALPDAGLTALARRSHLALPALRTKALARLKIKNLELVEVLLGELDDDDVIELQSWRYDPLVAGLGEVDNISLALTLIDLDDERVHKELSLLIGEESLWF
jgi:hypothetical protein